MFGALVALSLVGVAQPKSHVADHRPTHSLSGSLFATFDPTFQGTGAWIGYAYLSIGNQPAKLATLVDRGTSVSPRANGGIYGTETITFTFADGSGTFAVPVSFSAAPGSTPNMFSVQEHGPIGNGTGSYAGASGFMTTRGSAIVPQHAVAMPWMAEISGFITGVSD